MTDEMSDSLRTVSKWLNEETGSLPRREIAEVCVENERLRQRVREWQSSAQKAHSLWSADIDKMRQLEAELAALKRA